MPDNTKDQDPNAEMLQQQAQMVKDINELVTNFITGGFGKKAADDLAPDPGKKSSKDDKDDDKQQSQFGLDNLSSASDSMVPNPMQMLSGGGGGSGGKPPFEGFDSLVNSSNQMQPGFSSGSAADVVKVVEANPELLAL